MTWRWLDTVAHWLHLPRWLGRGWVCDHYDHALGLTWEEIRR